MQSWQAWPSVMGIKQSLESLYEQWEANGKCWPLEQQQKVSAAIHAEYDWDTIVRDQWAPLMTKLAGEWEMVNGGANA